MSTTMARYIDSGSYARGNKRYQQQRALWYNLKFAGTILCVLGGAILGTTTLNSSYLEPMMPTIVNVGAGIILLGIIATTTVPTIIKERRVDETPYQFVLHYMTEMGIPDPRKVLDANPGYIKAFEEVRKAVTALEAKHKGKVAYSHDLSPNAHRIGSLILRDQRSLDLTPHLLGLIQERELEDYDSLAALLDEHDNHPTSLTEGIL